jgi:hypothetical protein
MIFNNRLDAGVTACLALMVLILIAEALGQWIAILSGRKVQLHESPYGWRRLNWRTSARANDLRQSSLALGHNLNRGPTFVGQLCSISVTWRARPGEWSDNDVDMAALEADVGVPQVLESSAVR